MLSLKQIVLKSLGGILLSCLVATPAVAKLSIEEINSIARQTTVLIAPGLTPELISEIENNRNNPLASQKNKEGVWNPGSGVLIAKQGKTYYVLTVAHNFSQRFLDQNVPFGIRTSDRQVHVVKQVNDHRGCPLSDKGVPAAVVRFGCRSGEVHGVDLAIVSFESDRNYPIASLGDANTVNLGDTVYVSGWPDPEKELDPVTSECRGRVARRQRRLAWGPVTGKLNPDPQNLGYSLFYTDNTRAGMSGGPVFDINGHLVGNHGLGRSTKPQCGGNVQPTTVTESEATLASHANSASLPRKLDFNSLIQQYSGSQQVNLALSLIKKVGINLPFNFDPPPTDLLRRGMSSGGIQAIAQASGKVEFDAGADAFEDPNDVVEDIYKLYSFRLENQIRDCPSAGAGSLLLGDRDGCDGT